MKTGILEGPNSNKMLTGHNAATHPVLTVVAAVAEADQVAAEVMVVAVTAVVVVTGVVEEDADKIKDGYLYTSVLKAVSHQY